MFRRMLDHPLITYETGVDFADVRGALDIDGSSTPDASTPISTNATARCPYRSLEFRHEHRPDVAQFQPVGTVNYPNDHEFTRITEFKHLTGQAHPGTSIVYEFPRDEGEPFYPVPRPQNEALYKKYEARAAACANVTFVGRLAQYRYYNMDQVVGAAIAAAGRLIPQLAKV